MKKVLIGMLAVILVISLCACSKCEEHKFLSSKYRVEKEATCASEGIGVKVCGECGYEEEVPITVEHNYVVIGTTQKCTKSGKITYECSVCKNTYKKDADALGHSWVAATCQKAKHCSRCNTTEGGKAEHEFSGTKCTVCGKENTKTVTCKGVKFIVPIEITANNSGTETKISNITITFNDTYDSYSTFYVNYSAECIESAGYGNAFSYTLYDKEGYVISSGTEHATELKAGEKTRNQSFDFDLPHVSGDLKVGETYKLVISDYD